MGGEINPLNKHIRKAGRSLLIDDAPKDSAGGDKPRPYIHRASVGAGFIPAHNQIQSNQDKEYRHSLLRLYDALMVFRLFSKLSLLEYPKRSLISKTLQDGMERLLGF
jgi:hypothetical protein